MERSVIVILGPTGSGKTHLGILLAKILNSEIISADSKQFYKKLNIGTAKPSAKQLAEVNHHFINFLEPDENYNASDFEMQAEEIIEIIFSRSLIPIVVGGSGLYIKALVDGIFNTVDKDFEYREKLLDYKNQFGNEYLYNLLKEKDPQSAERMLPQNWKRVMRALEVYHLSGEPIWKHHERQRKENKYSCIQIGLNWDRKTLYKNINKRVDSMIEEGLVEEVKGLLTDGYNKELNSLNTVGYKEIISYLDNEISIERAIELIKRNTRRYAKRQFTWFRKDNRIEWFDLDDQSELEKIAIKIANRFKQFKLKL
ncbi:MAG: tRNA (adenosine(37)-N6)-dimethylallyltransferase MiaA [Ignavibacteriaceae bacterium]|nr:tRNA (adenosine(37)-N6)-dimethylallyltransferase MiaA [Ignavibacteriaceae bacterium]